jgi:hypothetical protein
MKSNLPPSGNFSQVPLHELLVKLLQSKFSGSMEVKAGSTTRIFHLDNGNLCAATSNHPVEKIEQILEETLVPTLRGEQKKELKRRVRGGEAIATVLIDMGVLRANDLLSYNRNLAEWVLKGALSDKASEFRLNEGKPGQYNPVPFDPMEAIRESILNDLDDETVARRLGSKETIFTTAGDFSLDKSPDKNNPEIVLLVSNLNGTRTLGETCSRLGLNPDRSARLMYYLKLRGWIGVGGSRALGPSDEGRAVITGLAQGLTEAYRPRESIGDGDEDILRLLEEDVYEVPADTAQGGEPFSRALKAKVKKKRKEKPSDLWLPESFTDKLWAVLGAVKPYILPIGVAVAIIVAVMLIMNLRLPAPASAELSFYQESDDTSRAALQEEFSAEITDVPAVIYPVTNKIEVKPESKPEQESETAAEETQPKAEEKKETKTTVPRRRVEFAAIQNEALTNLAARRWDEAAALWRDALSSNKDGPFTLKITEMPIASAARINWVFGEIENSKPLLSKFFVLRSGEGSGNKYFVCWGLFNDYSSAEAGAESLPRSLRSAYGPTPFSIMTLLEAP